MKTKKLSIALLLVISVISTLKAQDPFMLSPNGTTQEFFKYITKDYNVDGTIYHTGFINLSGYKEITSGTTGTFYNTAPPVQKLQLQGGNILLSRTGYTPGAPDINPTSRNGAILFGDTLSAYSDWIHGKWGIEYDDQYSTGGLNIFKPVSSLTASRINFNLFVRNNGNVGIGTGDPVAKLQIADGDIFIQDIARGIIMKSPDGRCWRGTMNNQGQLQFAELPDCTVLSDGAKNETPATSTLKVYPNPVTNTLTIDLQQFENKKVLLRVNNLSGQAVAEKTVFSSKSFAFDVSALPAGSYILQVIFGVESENIKFVKK